MFYQIRKFNFKIFKRLEVILVWPLALHLLHPHLHLLRSFIFKEHLPQSSSFMKLLIDHRQKMIETPSNFEIVTFQNFILCFHSFAILAKYLLLRHFMKKNCLFVLIKRLLSILIILTTFFSFYIIKYILILLDM